MCAAVVCVVFYVLTRSFELKSKLLWTFNKNIRRELQVGDFNISPLPMKWYKNWKDMWHFTAKKMTNIESNEKLVIKKKQKPHNKTDVGCRTQLSHFTIMVISLKYINYPRNLSCALPLV